MKVLDKDGLTHFWGKVKDRYISKNAYAYGFKPENSASANVEAMQSLLNESGIISITVPGTYLVNSNMKIYSNTYLYFGPGVKIKLTAHSDYVFINEGAFSNNTNENITIDGYYIDTDNIVTYASIYGLRGYLSFLHVKNLTIKNVRCDFYPAHVFFMHICDFENVSISRCRLIGDKDAMHFSKGTNLIIRDCTVCSVDDCIALNAWDFAESNPEIGDITNVEIENIIELSHSANSQSAYDRTLGYTVRMLNGAWLAWSSGMNVQHSTTVIHNGNMYRCINLSDGTTKSSTVAPSSTRGKSTTGSDNIEWKNCGPYTKLSSAVKKASIRDVTSYQNKSVAFISFNSINEVNHKSWVPGAVFDPSDDIVIDNFSQIGGAPAFLEIGGDVANFEVINSKIDTSVLTNGIFKVDQHFSNASTYTQFYAFFDKNVVKGDNLVLSYTTSSSVTRTGVIGFGMNRPKGRLFTASNNAPVDGVGAASPIIESGYLTYYKVQDLIYLYIYGGTGLKSGGSAWTTVGSLPLNYQPLSDYYAPINGGSYGASYHGELRVRTTGEVEVAFPNYSSNSVNYISGSALFASRNPASQVIT